VYIFENVAAWADPVMGKDKDIHSEIKDAWEALSREFASSSYFAETAIRGQELTREFAENVPPERGPVLEIGSYEGYNSMALQALGYAVHAVDLPAVVSQQQLRAPYEQRQIPFKGYQISAQGTIPYPDEFFSGIMVIEVLEHLPVNPLYLFSEIQRVLKPGGLALLTTPNQVRLRGRAKVLLGRSMNDDVMRLVKSFHQEKGYDDSGYHWKLYTANEVMSLAVASDLTVAKVVYRLTPCHSVKSLAERLLYCADKLFGFLLPGCRDWLVFWIKKPEETEKQTKSTCRRL